MPPPPSLVSRRLYRAVSDPFFRLRLHELHRTPPVLGFLHNRDDEDIPRFVHSTASAFPLAAPDDNPSWEVVVDCRHGRALFLIHYQVARELLIWEPITGAQHRVPVPAAFENLCPTAAVFCPVEGCSHYNCIGGPFRVVFVFAVDDNDEAKFFTSASVYSSETGTWGEVTRILNRAVCFSSPYRSSVLVWRSLFYFMADGSDILEYDLDSHALARLESPDPYTDTFSLMVAEDGGLGVCKVSDPQQLKLWSWQESDDDDTDGQSVLSRVIYLGNLLPNGALPLSSLSKRVLFFAEVANVIFVTTDDGVFTIELQSERAKKVCDHHFWCLVPVVSFYTPPRLLNLSEEAGGEEGGVKEEKTVERAHQLFGKGTNAVKEGDFDHSFINHDLKTRSVSNEESVMGTSSKDDAGNSKISGSNIMDAASPSEKGDSEEGSKLNSDKN